MSRVVLATPTETQAVTTLNHNKVRELGLKKLAESGVTEEYLFDDKPILDVLKIEFLTAQDIGKRRLRMMSAPGILHTYFKPDNSVNGLRAVRYIPGHEPVDAEGKTVRYSLPAGAMPDLYLAPLVDWVSVFHDPTRPLYFTEGWLKSLAAIMLLGLDCLSYSGINSFWTNRRLLDVYNEIVWRDRAVYLINDADVPGNPDSRKAENEHARLLTERSARVLICRYPKNCKVGKLDDAAVQKGKQWCETYLLKKAVEWDPATASDIPLNLTEEKVPTVADIPVIPKGAMYGIAKQLTDLLQTPPSLTYVAALVALASSQLPIQGATRGTLYGVLLNRSGGGKSAITDNIEIFMRNNGCINSVVMRTMPLSDRGLLNALKERCPTISGDAMFPSVLILMDELKGLFSKAAIDNATIYTVLNDLFYHTVHDVADRKGVHGMNPVNLNLLGNLPCKSPTQFTDLFGADTQEGFYRRCLFGVGLRAETFKFALVAEEKLRDLAHKVGRSNLKVTQAMIDHTEKWKAASVDDAQRARREMIAELIIRVALVTSSATGDDKVTEKALLAATTFIEWQEQIRIVYTPSMSKSPYAQCMDMVVTALEQYKGLVNWGEAYKKGNWHRKEFSDSLRRVKGDLIENGILVPVPGQKGVFYYRKEEQ